MSTPNHDVDRWADDGGPVPPDPEPPARTMSDYDATMIAEGCVGADFDTQVAAWQHLVDTGLAWKLQGWSGRRASDLIENGVIQPPVIAGST